MIRPYYPAGFISLLCGGLIYLFFRPESLLLFSWADHLGLSSSLENIRTLSLPLAPKLGDWVLFSLPNGLWVISFALLALGVCGDKGQNAMLVLAWTSLLCLIAIASEALQYTGTVPGTFDWNDILAYGLPLLALVTFLWGRNNGEV